MARRTKAEIRAAKIAELARKKRELDDLLRAEQSMSEPLTKVSRTWWSFAASITLTPSVWSCGRCTC